MQIRFEAPPTFSFLQLYLHNLILVPVIIPQFDKKKGLIFFHEMMQLVTLNLF